MVLTAWKVSVFGLFLVRISPNSGWIRRNTQTKCRKIRTKKTPNTDTFQAEPILPTGKLDMMTLICNMLLLSHESFSWRTNYSTNTPRRFHVETTWKRLFLRHFNVESRWCVCRVAYAKMPILRTNIILENKKVFRNNNLGM